jgi:hypothetical protein
MTHEGTEYVCGVCKKEITVVAEDSHSYPYHLDNCLRISCHHCAELCFISGIHNCSNPECLCKDVSKINAVASTLMLFIQECALLDEQIIPNLRHEITASKHIVAILTKQLNQSVSSYKTASLHECNLPYLYANCINANSRVCNHTPITEFGISRELVTSKRRLKCEITHDFATIKYHENKIKKNETLLENLEKRIRNVKNGCIAYIVNQYTTPPIFTQITTIDPSHTDIGVYIEEENTMMLANMIIENDDKKTNAIPIQTNAIAIAIPIQTDTPGWVHDVDIPYRDN